MLAFGDDAHFTNRLVFGRCSFDDGIVVLIGRRARLRGCLLGLGHETSGERGTTVAEAMMRMRREPVF